MSPMAGGEARLEALQRHAEPRHAWALTSPEAQRDYFGAHTHQRTDWSGADAVHFDWAALSAAATMVR